MEPFNFSRTYSRAFGLIRDTFGSVGVFLLIVQVASGAISYGLSEAMGTGLGAASDGSALSARMAMFASPLYWVSVAVSLVIAGVSYAGSAAGFLAAGRGRQVSIADCFTMGFAQFLPVLGLLILWGLGVGLGWILFLVPGLILMTMWSAALPAKVGEPIGVIDAFGRSRQLTKGSRLTIFAVLLVALIIMYAPMLVLGGVLAGGIMSGLTTGNATQFGVATMGFAVVYGWLIALFIQSLLVSIYLETTLIKEGGGSGQLTEVFG